MTNNSSRRVKPAVARNVPSICAALRAGYLDAVAGRGYCPRYETATRVWQRNYENGRMVAIALRCSDNTLPVWRGNVKLPNWFIDAARKAIAENTMVR